MKNVDRNEILRLGDYEQIRPQFRARVIAEKKDRRIRVGARVTAVFETHDSVLLQVQEMLRTERITREPAIQHEIETYNELVPGNDELSLTAMIEIDDKTERDRFLVAARGIESAFYVEVDGERFRGKVNPARMLDDRASAVIYLKFPVAHASAERVRHGTAKVVIVGVEHDAYTARETLSPAVVACIAEDLRDPSS